MVKAAGLLKDRRAADLEDLLVLVYWFARKVEDCHDSHRFPPSSLALPSSLPGPGTLTTLRTESGLAAGPGDRDVTRRPGDRARSGDARRDDHGNDRQENDHGHHGIHFGELLPEPDRAEDPQRQSVLRARGEHRDDDLIERQGEGEQRAGNQRRGGHGKGYEPQCLPASR